MLVVVVRVVVRVANMIVVEVLYLVVRMEVVVILVRFYCCWWICGAIGCDGGILVVVVMSVVRVALLN